MAAHLVTKHEWIEALPDDDHVARILARGLDESRLDEVITEIADTGIGVPDELREKRGPRADRPFVIG